MASPQEEHLRLKEHLSQLYASAGEEEVGSPPPPSSIEETGLKESFLVNLTLKTLYVRGVLTGQELVNSLKLPYPRVLERVHRFIVDEALCQIRRGATMSPLTWEFMLTKKGEEAAQEALQRDGYVGPAPVPLEEYNRMMMAQTADWSQVTLERLKEATADMVISEELLNRLGPAFNSGKSIFLYGHAGNGKTMVAERMASTLRGGIFIPYAIEVGGQVIQYFDAIHHRPLEAPSSGSEERHLQHDERWILVRRPFIVVGGELKMETLELNYDPNLRYYIAPVQMKANGGVFMIDDFGRQQIPPRDLLNRWIVPLEKGVDYHTLLSGLQVEVPFRVLIIFSTNLDPKDLVEEAFLRRIRYKIEIPDPTEEQFREIFRRMCAQLNIPFEPKMVDHLLEKHYRPLGRGLRATHPRDLLLTLLDVARFRGREGCLTPELLDEACRLYFVEL